MQIMVLSLFKQIVLHEKRETHKIFFEKIRVPSLRLGDLMMESIVTQRSFCVGEDKGITNAVIPLR